MKLRLNIVILSLALFIIPNTIDAKVLNIEDNINTFDGVSKNSGEWVYKNGNIYYYVDGEMTKGVTEINGESYFFGCLSGKLWKNEFVDDLEGNKYYADQYGVIYKNGFYNIGGKTYYFNEDGIMLKGIQNINGKYYFLGYLTGILKKNEFVDDLDGNKYYADKDGVIYQGDFYDIGGKTYYFNENGIMLKGIQNINGKDYFLGYLTGILKKNEFVYDIDGNEYYADQDGVIYKNGFHGVGGNNYYFTDKGIMLKGIQHIGGAEYFLGYLTGMLKKNQFVDDMAGNTYYANSDGIVLKGIQDINGSKYFLGYITGILKKSEFVDDLDNNKYYADYFGIVQTGTKVINNNYYTFDSKGVLQSIRYVPVYYNQKDGRWAQIRYGNGTFGGSGCAPTSMAMAFTSILGKTISPIEVADYLYYNTNEYNKYTKGSSGLAIIRAAEHYDVKATPVGSKNELESYLKAGKIVFAAMGNGKFATDKYNHAIVLYNYNEGNTYVLDPLTPLKNGYTSINQIWSEQSKDPDDSRGGSNFYALDSKYFNGL